MVTRITWQKSSFSEGNGNCVELAMGLGGILVRESDRPDEVISTTPARLRAFVSGIKAGEFDHLL
ncbi:DUF397 domain-containing protein [Streptomyces sp. RKAG293]|uniref:DUF397 domain-containing protein n=1 Tax=Streptomyces sp. RKAG293 TaxID=2893403 RepID=UPI0020337582|nr:DUF397 domain-containing protein [Streptomyces sp. RKAG293]MCM2420981.1 DUF397 domain-containing protein [Streptomyces sp. RKAG293]